MMAVWVIQGQITWNTLSIVPVGSSGVSRPKMAECGQSPSLVPKRTQGHGALQGVDPASGLEQPEPVFDCDKPRR